MKEQQKIIDSWLVFAYKSGNKKAMSILVKKWHLKLCRQAYRYTKDMDAAKDIVQESWGIIINKIHKLKNTNQFSSWAMTIVTRKAIDYMNKNKYKIPINEAISAKMNSPNEDYSTEEKNINEVKKSISELSQDKQIILQLFYYENYSINEIAEIINIPVATVKTRLFRAREKLKLILKTSYYEK